MYTNNKNIMAIITTYPLEVPDTGDYLMGSKITTVGSQINPTKNFTVQSVVDAGVGYTVYTAVISQTGTSAPTVNKELKNNTGATFTWSRFNPGVYRIQASAPIFDQANIKTIVFLNQGSISVTADPVFISYGVQSNTLIEINTWSATTLNLADTGLQLAPIEIRIYS